MSSRVIGVELGMQMASWNPISMIPFVNCEKRFSLELALHWVALGCQASEPQVKIVD